MDLTPVAWQQSQRLKSVYVTTRTDAGAKATARSYDVTTPWDSAVVQLVDLKCQVLQSHYVTTRWDARANARSPSKSALPTMAKSASQGKGAGELHGAKRRNP